MKEELELKLSEYTDKLKKVTQMLQEYEIIAHKLQGAIEALDDMLKNLDKEAVKEN